MLALGAWSPRLARTLDLRLPIQPGKGYSITYERPARCPRIPLVCKERSVCVTAWSSGYRLGSTMEFAGFDASLNRTRLDALERGAGEYLHEPVGPRRLEEWYGWRPMTWDDLPIIGRSPRHPNLVLATGHGMLGRDHVGGDRRTRDRPGLRAPAGAGPGATGPATIRMTRDFPLPEQSP